MISSLLAYSLSKGIMPRWHQKWPCHRAMSLLKRPILLLLNKVAPPVICNQCMKPSLQGIHPRLHCKWFLPPFHPMPPRDRSLRMLLKAAWVLLPRQSTTAVGPCRPMLSRDIEGAPTNNIDNGNEHLPPIRALGRARRPREDGPRRDVTKQTKQIKSATGPTQDKTKTKKLVDFG
jgi:hypothetical protein